MIVTAQPPADELAVFHDVPVAPFRELLDSSRGGEEHWGGPSWPAWDEQRAARHQRGGRLIDREPAPPAVEQVVDLPCAWGGPIVGQFGHQVAEFSMRLLSTHVACPGWPILFAALEKGPHSLRSIEDAPVFFWSVLAWLGIRPERAVLISRPTKVVTLAVLPQGEQLGQGPTRAYLDLLDEVTRVRLGSWRRTRAVYVSRAKQRGRFAGEAYLERALQAAGCSVLRPEELPLAEQLRAYAGAESLIFPEGSAIHATQLLGRSLQHVWVIRRRRGPGRFGLSALQPRAQSVAHVDAIAHLVTPLLPSGQPARALGITILDAERLLTELAPCLPELDRHLDRRAFHDAQEADLRNWLGEAFQRAWPHSPHSVAHLKTELDAAGFGHLSAEAGRLLETNGSYAQGGQHR